MSTETRELATFATDKSITVYFPGVGSKEIQFTNPNFVKVQEALRGKEYDTLLDLMDPIRTITKWGNGNLTVVDNQVLIDGQPVSSPSLSGKIMDLWRAGLPIDAYVAFNGNMRAVRSNRMHTQLLTYLERHEFPLFNDGAFLAYKVLAKNPYLGLVEEPDTLNAIVKDAYRNSPQNPYTKVNGRYLSDFEYYKELLLSKPYVDIHSKSVPQGVGDTISMDTRYVNDNPTEGCSTGLHVGASGYMRYQYDDTYPRLLVKVFPINCISVPLDANFQKIRVDEYTIVEVDTKKVEYPHPAYLNAQVQSNDGDEEYDEEGYDRDGYDRDGYDRDGYDREGLDEEGYDVDGYDDDGYNRDGYGPEDDEDEDE